MLDNATRRQLLERHKSSGFPGSIIDVYNAYNQGIDLISQFEMSSQPQVQVANTPQQQQEGLRPFHQQGQTNQSMVFPNVPANTNFNTVGMKAPINIKKVDNQGNLVKSYENVPPGIHNLPTGPVGGTVIETPANMQSGGVRKYQAGDALPTFGKTAPDWRATGPALRVNDTIYRDHELTGATRIPIDPETGEQLPILLPTADVVGRQKYDDAITEAINRTGSGLLGEYASPEDYKKMEGAVRSGMNNAGKDLLYAAGDVLSAPQRYLVNAPLAYGLGKTPNLSMFPLADRARGINQPNAFPSETLEIKNPIGAFATDVLTDPSVVASLGVGLGRAGLKQVADKAAKYATTQTPLRNAYKINPWAFKPQEGMMYRGLGEEGFKDAMESGLLRPRQYNYPAKRNLSEIVNSPKQFTRTYFAPSEQFDVVRGYGSNYIAEVPKTSDFARRYGRQDWSWSTGRQIPLEEANLYKQDWLRGYRQINPPKQLPGSNTFNKYGGVRNKVPYYNKLKN